MFLMVLSAFLFKKKQKNRIISVKFPGCNIKLTSKCLIRFKIVCMLVLRDIMNRNHLQQNLYWVMVNIHTHVCMYKEVLKSSWLRLKSNQMSKHQNLFCQSFLIWLRTFQYHLFYVILIGIISHTMCQLVSNFRVTISDDI